MKLFLACAVISFTFASVATPIQTEAAAITFLDVPTSNAYYKEISEMTAKGIIHGYEDGAFKPNQLITRQHAATLLVRAFKPKGNYKREFKDMSKKNAYYNDMVYAVAYNWLEAKDGKVRPNDNITRGEMAWALTRAAEISNDSTQEGFNLTDVSSYYRHAITSLFNSKITTGFEDRTFRENEGLSRAHFSVFMYRAITFIEAKKEAAKGSIFNKSYIGQYPTSEVPIPKAYAQKFSGDFYEKRRKMYEEQNKKYDELKAFMPRGSYKSKLAAEDAERYDSILKSYQKELGLLPETVAKHVDEAAKTGDVIYFTGDDGQKYFVIFQFFANSIMLGEDHRK